MAERKNFRFYWEEPLKKEAKEGPSMHIEVPGFGKDEIDVRLSRNSVTVSASKKGRRVEKGKGFYFEEASASSFSRTMALPYEMDPEDFEVFVADGIVTLKRKKPNKIKVNKKET